ncbi:LacI family DNA-binding transcriptional regulator [Jonesiaceae bacterium BS-20]|uniref:LacI family DNA-binding transcriptional regulator n=1 Tax=Jonesiaceae bacterium BS-20 TaxID=3120821 RepID=A0AAU7DTL5_9MICO
MASNIHDVARLAGVSPRTVSNVVNNFIHVRPETRERVQKAIAALDYRPNISARRLRQGLTKMIGFAVPELSQPYFSELSELFEIAARKRGYTLIATQTGGLKEREYQMLKEFSSHMVDGLIYSPMSLTKEDLHANPPLVPTVLIGEQISSPNHFNIAIDNSRAIEEITTNLINAGRTKIAILGAYHSSQYRSSRLRLEGYHRALDQAGIPRDEQLILYTDQFGRSAGRSGVHDAVTAGITFDAIVCLNDVLALGAIRALADLGISVPSEVAITGFDDIEDSAFCVPSLTTISPDKQEIADTAISTLLALIEKTAGEPADIEVAYTHQVRESTAS